MTAFAGRLDHIPPEKRTFHIVPDDDEKKNLNKTKYRIQIVRVVHAVKEIITGMKNEPAQIVKDRDLTEGKLKVAGKGERRIDLKKPDKAIKWKLVSTIAIIAAFIIVATLSIPKIFKQFIPKNFGSAGEKISVSVIPFQNMTKDTVWNIWQDGIQDKLITSC